MPSYAITGCNRGIGLELVRQLSTNADNLIFALVLDVNDAALLDQLASSRPNIHIAHADLLDTESLKAAAEYIDKTTGGSLDYLINNGALLLTDRRFYLLTDYLGHEDELEKDFIASYKVNVIGVIRTVNLFLPLLKKGNAKKVITLTSGVGESEFTLRTDYLIRSSYCASKAALNLIVAKYATQFRGEGIAFFAISPGLIKDSTPSSPPPSAEEVEVWTKMVAGFKKGFPEWSGRPITTIESVELMLELIDKFTIADTGAFVSQYGTKQWL